MTIEEIKTLGIPNIDYCEYACLLVESGLQWLLNNTKLEFDIHNVEEIKELPPNVKLFLLKFIDLMRISTGVTSESIEGMSQSFDSSGKDLLLRQYALELLGKDLMISDLKFYPAVRKWV